MIALYILIGSYLYSVNIINLIMYCIFFIVTILLQSYNCINWECPHIGTFCPGAGGFCVLASPVAKLLIILKVKRSENVYKIVCNCAWLCFFGIILFPVYFIYKASVLYLITYLAIIFLYFAGMMLFICPKCGAKTACPGGQFSSKIKKNKHNA